MSESINKSEKRYGNFTSSGIWALMAVAKNKVDFGEKALTYIKTKQKERRLGRSISGETNAKPTSWGSHLESRVFDLLGLEYTLTSTDTDIHPTIPYWSGSKDGTNENIEGGCIIDIKCPFTLNSFCDLVDPIYEGLTGMDAMNEVRERHTDGEKYYWQLVSNAIINNCKFGELIVYVPYASELLEIGESSKGNPAMRWLEYSADEVPYLIDGGYYQNINKIRFEIPQADKDLLTEKVLKAGKLLIQNKI